MKLRFFALLLASLFALVGGPQALVSVATAADNQPPLAGSVQADVPANVTTNIRLGGLDPDGGAVTYSLVTKPTHGTVVDELTGPFVVYTPTAGYAGPDAFVYRITDSEGAYADGQVDINVKGATPSCNSVPATLVLAQPGQRTYGTNGVDVVVITAAGASFYGLAGNDVICVSAAAYVFAGAGDDSISVNANGAAIFAGDGNDVMTGGNGFNQLFGGNGRDVITVGDGNSWLLGGSGNDTLKAGHGGNVLVGGDGDDDLTTGDAMGYMWGGNGADSFHTPTKNWRG